MMPTRFNGSFLSWIFVLLAASCPSIAQDAAKNPIEKKPNASENRIESSLGDSNPRDDFVHFRELVKRESIPERPAAFDKNAKILLSKWQDEVSGEVDDLIKSLKNTNHLSSRIEIIEQIGDKGTDARGAALELVEVLGNNRVSIPPEILFWKPSTEERIVAANSLINMGEAVATALVYANTHDFNGITLQQAVMERDSGDDLINSYITRFVTSNIALKSIFDVDEEVGISREDWVRMLLASPVEQFSATTRKSFLPPRNFWQENEFLWSIGFAVLLALVATLYKATAK